MVVQRTVRLPKIQGKCEVIQLGGWTGTVLLNRRFFFHSQGRHKRNATFPGGQATTILQSQRKSDKRFSHFAQRNTSCSLHNLSL